MSLPKKGQPPSLLACFLCLSCSLPNNPFLSRLPNPCSTSSRFSSASGTVKSASPGSRPSRISQLPSVRMNEKACMCRDVVSSLVMPSFPWGTSLPSMAQMVCVNLCVYVLRVCVCVFLGVPLWEAFLPRSQSTAAPLPSGVWVFFLRRSFTSFGVLGRSLPSSRAPRLRRGCTLRVGSRGCCSGLCYNGCS